MANPTAKIVKVDTSKIVPNPVSKDTPSGTAWMGVSEVSFMVEVAHEGLTYTRKLTFRMHDEKIHNFGGAITPEAVQEAILAEANQIKSLHEVAAAMELEIDVDQVAKAKQ